MELDNQTIDQIISSKSFKRMRRLFTLPLIGLLTLTVITEGGPFSEFFNVGKDAVYYECDDQLSAEAVYEEVDKFSPTDRDVYNFGLTEDALWVYLDLSDYDRTLDNLCQLEPRMGLFEIYEIGDLVHPLVYQAGMSFPFDKRDLDVSTYLYRIPKDSPRRFLLKFKSRNNRSIPIFLSSDVSVIHYLNRRSMINGLYFGLLLIMILYNSFVYFSVKDKNYLYYILFLIGMGLTQGYMTGILQQYVIPNAIFFKVRGSALYPPVVGILAILFITHILGTRKKMLSVHKMLVLVAIIYGISGLVGILSGSSLAYILTQSANLIGSVLVFVAAIKTMLAGSVTGRYIFGGWTFIILSLMLYIFTENGLLPFNYAISPHYIQIGSGFEVLLFSFALAERINRYKEERIVAVSEKEQLLRQSIIKDKENNKKLAAMELTALRGQMNPHFIFNALGAIRYYIQHNEPDKADNYLTKFARLIRKYLDTSRESMLSLREELVLLTLYTDLEMMRFGKKFRTEIEVDPSLDVDEEYLPAMLVQPLVENAVNHGLNDRLDEKGLLNIRFMKTPQGMDIEVIDNGIGVAASRATRVTERKSMGTDLIEERITTIGESGLGKVTMDYSVVNEEDLQFPGTKVKLSLSGFDDERG